MPAHVERLVGSEGRPEIVAGSFELNGAIRQQNQRGFLRLGQIRANGVPVRVRNRPGEGLQRGGAWRVLSHHFSGRRPTASGEAASGKTKHLEQAATRKASLDLSHGTTSDCGTIFHGRKACQPPPLFPASLKTTPGVVKIGTLRRVNRCFGPAR